VIYGSTQIGAERDPVEQVDRKLCNIVLFGEAARVERTQPRSNPPNHPVPQVPFPVLGGAADLPESMAEPEVPREAALRVKPELRFLRVRSVKVETSTICPHRCDDGLVRLIDFEGDGD
jgi:hypothetical protein